MILFFVIINKIIMEDILFIIFVTLDGQTDTYLRKRRTLLNTMKLENSA